MRPVALLGTATLAFALSASILGCAFFTKSDPVVLRYFTPESIGTPPRPLERALSRGPEAAELRIGRVNAASYLKDRIAFRDESFEIGYYERLRWTEKPEAYLRRALGRELFQEHGVRQIISGSGTTLDVDLDAFEELRSPRHAARIEVTWVLHDDQRVQFQETFTIERLIESREAGSTRGIAPAMAGAFADAVRRIASEVVAALPKGPAAGVGLSARSSLAK